MNWASWADSWIMSVNNTHFQILHKFIITKFNQNSKWEHSKSKNSKVIIISLYYPTLGKFIMSSQEKRHDVMARIWTSDLTIKRPTLYHLSYPVLCWRKKWWHSSLVPYFPNSCDSYPQQLNHQYNHHQHLNLDSKDLGKPAILICSKLEMNQWGYQEVDLFFIFWIFLFFSGIHYERDHCWMSCSPPATAFLCCASKAWSISSKR
jgi:hypothetical protein